MVTKEVSLPTFKELESTEINLSTATLMAAAPFLGIKCEDINNEFMLCRQETRDERSCVALGKLVTQCALKVFKMIKKECLEEFKQYANCVDKSSGDYGFRYCRKTQEVLDACMDEKLCIQRPHWGYFCRGRIHTSPSSPPPSPDCPCQPKVCDATPSLPDCRPRPPPRFGSRWYWVNE